MPCILHIRDVNLPNAITLSRLVLAAIFVVAMEFPGLAGYSIALVSFSVAAATDWPALHPNYGRVLRLAALARDAERGDRAVPRAARRHREALLPRPEFC